MKTDVFNHLAPGQRSSANLNVDSKLPTQQRSLRSVGLNILESSMQSGPVATLPLSGTLIQPPHGIVNPEKRTQGTGHRQVKENFINLAVQKCGPAVVRIQAEQKVEVPALSTRFVKLKTEAVFLSIAMG